MTPNPSPTPSRRPLLLALGGCVLVALCALVIGGGAAGAWFFTRARVGQPGEPAVEYILDASPRMALATEGGTRLSVAQGVLAEIVRPADPSLTAGLRVFGTGANADTCKDTDLVVPLAPSNQTEVSSRALEVQAGAAADAALAEAMVAAIRDLAATAGPHTLVVITGGADSCNEQAGQLIAQEAERAGVKLQTFVVGYQVPEDEAEAIRGLVDDAGNTTYLEALDADELRQILNAIQKYVDDPTTTFPTVTLGTPAAVAIGPTLTAGAAATAGPASTDAGSDPGPDPTAVVEPDATAGAAGYPAQTACDHPYFPLREGATWTYAMETGSYTWSVTSVSGDLDQAEVTMVFAMDDVTIDYHWTCTREGLVSYDFGNVNVASEGSINFEVSNAEGTWLPPAEQMVPGYSWVNNYSMQSSFEGAGTSMTVVTTVNESRTVAGVETSTSEAGTFDTLRVDSTGTYQSSIPGIPTSSFDSSSSAWFAYGVGLVRQVSTGEGSSSTLTLVSYSIP